MALTLRRATPADLPPIAHLMNTAYRGEGSDAGWTTETAYITGDRTTEALLQAEIASRPNAFLLIANLNTASSISACVWLDPLSADTWYLGSLTVHPQFQNSGVGRGMLAAAEQWAVAQGARTIQITVVNVRTTLIAWYERRGYHRTGKIKPFPYADTRFGTPLRDDLAFVVLEKQLPRPHPDTTHSPTMI